MAIKIGVTGGIGSGKSIISKLLELMGIPVYVADTEAKRLTNTDPVIRRELCALFGENIFNEEGLNRPLLASYLFGCPAHAKYINGIIHPQVKEDFRRWVDANSSYPIVGMESAILIESGFNSEVDVIVMVYAPMEVRIQRVLKRDNSSRELVMKRIESQMNDEDKRRQAEFVIVNDDEMPVIPQVLELISFLSKNIDYLCPSKK